MKIVQMSVTRTFLDRRGLPISVGITAQMHDCDDIGRCWVILRQMLEAKTAPAPIVYQVEDSATPRRPSKDQWYRLRQLLVKKKHIDSDSDVFEYVTGKLGTEDIDMVSAEEVEKLISELEEN
ncbi:MAG: hypothetical protein ABII64_02445 [Elusimicrobiota bacterium]